MPFIKPPGNGFTLNIGFMSVKNCKTTSALLYDEIFTSNLQEREKEGKWVGGKKTCRGRRESKTHKSGYKVKKVMTAHDSECYDHLT